MAASAQRTEELRIQCMLTVSFNARSLCSTSASHALRSGLATPGKPLEPKHQHDAGYGKQNGQN